MTRHFDSISLPPRVITGTAPRHLAGKVATYFGGPSRIIYEEAVFVEEGTDQ